MILVVVMILVIIVIVMILVIIVVVMILVIIVVVMILVIIMIIMVIMSVSIKGATFPEVELDQPVSVHQRYRLRIGSNAFNRLL